MNFQTLDYLATGNARQRLAHQVLVGKGIFEVLSGFTPTLAGTIPIGIDLPESDLDVICSWGRGTDPDNQDHEGARTAFVACLQKGFAAHDGFELWQGQYHGHQTAIANFRIAGFAVEVFGQARPVTAQEAYRHMVVEHALLIKHGEVLRSEVMRLKRSGIKTEPAFAQALGLKGDPYEALLGFGI